MERCRALLPYISLVGHVQCVLHTVSVLGQLRQTLVGTLQAALRGSVLRSLELIECEQVAEHGVLHQVLSALNGAPTDSGLSDITVHITYFGPKYVVRRYVSLDWSSLRRLQRLHSFRLSLPADAFSTPEVVRSLLSALPSSLRELSVSPMHQPLVWQEHLARSDWLPLLTRWTVPGLDPLSGLLTGIITTHASAVRPVEWVSSQHDWEHSAIYLGLDHPALQLNVHVMNLCHLSSILRLELCLSAASLAELALLPVTAMPDLQQVELNVHSDGTDHQRHMDLTAILCCLASRPLQTLSLSTTWGSFQPISESGIRALSGMSQLTLLHLAGFRPRCWMGELDQMLVAGCWPRLLSCTLRERLPSADPPMPSITPGQLSCLLLAAPALLNIDIQCGAAEPDFVGLTMILLRCRHVRRLDLHTNRHQRSPVSAAGLRQSFEPHHSQQQQLHSFWSSLLQLSLDQQQFSLAALHVLLSHLSSSAPQLMYLSHPIAEEEPSAALVAVSMKQVLPQLIKLGPTDARAAAAIYYQQLPSASEASQPWMFLERRFSLPIVRALQSVSVAEQLTEGAIRRHGVQLHKAWLDAADENTDARFLFRAEYSPGISGRQAFFAAVHQLLTPDHRARLAKWDGGDYADDDDGVGRV